jgi:hypothetical protein
MHKTIIRGTLAMTAAAAGLLVAAGGASASTASDRGLPAAHAAASASKTFEDVVINPQSTTAYFTVPAKNEVAVLDLQTGVYGKPIPVGSDPQGIDITPNGETLYVCDSGAQVISKVNIAAGTVTSIPTPPGDLSDTPFSIAVMNNGNALFSTTFSGSGFGGNVYDLNLKTDAIKAVTSIGLNGQVTEDTPLSRSADHSTVGAVLGDDSGGFFYIYKAATGNVVSGELNDFISSSSLNGNGSTMLVDGISVIDASTGSLLGTINDSGGSSVLTSSGSVGYVLEQNSIVKLNITRFLTGKSIPLSSPAGGGAQLALSRNGKFLVAETANGATIVNL